MWQLMALLLFEACQLYILILVVWQLMALLLLRHALTIGNGDGDDDDVSTFFAVSGLNSGFPSASVVGGIEHLCYV